MNKEIEKRIHEFAEQMYQAGYEDGTKAKDGERGSIYYGGYSDGYKDGQKDALKAKGEIIASEIAACKKAYEKGLKHGQELRAKEAECAEACGMKRAWDAARKVILSPDKGGLSSTNIHQIFDTSDYLDVLHKYSASEVIEKIDVWEKKQKENEKVDCNNTDCKNCINHNACDYEDEWKLRRRGIVPAPPEEEQTECMRDATPEESKSVNDYIKSISEETGVTFNEKEEQTEKSCKNCAHRISEKRNFNETVFKCDAEGDCENQEQWIPKQDALEMNVGSIENRDKIMKAIAGLLAAYGEQIWDVVADMQKNP